MLTVKTFENPNFGSIRVANTSSGEPIFCLGDLCDSLGLTNSRKVKSQIDDDVTLSYPIVDGLGRQQSATFVTEPGMYLVILRSNSVKAKPLQRWVTSEVLPAIRKTGGYMVSNQSDSNEDIMARALLIANDTIARIKNRSQQLETKTIELEAKIEADQPRVLFSKAVETSEKSILVGELATILRQNNISIGQNRMFEYLRENHYLISRKGDMYNQPTQKGLDLGLFELKVRTVLGGDGKQIICKTTKITSKGILYFVDKFLNSKSL